MTFRAKPVVKRAHRPAWETQDRRNFYLNLGFGLIVVLAILILVIAAGLNYYNDHLASVGSVDGQSISKDEFNERVKIESWRLTENENRTRTEVAAGHMTAAQGTAAQDAIDQQRNQLGTIALERIIDSKLQAKLAAEEGVTSTPADVDARLLVEATIPELRHVWMIEVKPETDLGSIGASEAQKTAAKAKAEAVVKDIQGGKAWEDVAKSASTDASTAPQSGDLGWMQAESTSLDEAFTKALFAVAVNTPTAVVEGADGIFRVGRVTEISAPSVDTAYQAKIQNEGISLDRYRAIVTADVIHQKLEDKIVADVTGPGPQRKVSEIYIREPETAPAAGAVKVRHILYAPNGDASTASTVPDKDPAWTAALSKATQTYAEVKANPSLFDAIARSSSDEQADRGATGTGGKLPYFDSSSDLPNAAAFKAAILAPGLKAGDILPPVKSDFGYHVIQIMYKAPDVDQLKALKTQIDGGADFAILARDNSDGQNASVGGDLGWVAKGQLTEALSTAIFSAPVGKTSEILTVAGDGIYLFKVFAEETRTPEGRQLADLSSTAFSQWYDAKKSAATITRDPSITDSTTS